jgi:hypothetical protein
MHTQTLTFEYGQVDSLVGRKTRVYSKIGIIKTFETFEILQQTRNPTADLRVIYLF